MLPSSLTSSPIAAAGRRPASRARSTAASVWPGRRSTPPSLARSGKTCPGRVRSSAFASGSASSRIVRARSAAEIPVVTPALASAETVYAVCLRSSLVWCIGGSASRSQSAPVSGTQSTPLVQRTKKPISSGVASSAAMTRSPSFSRSASSTTTTGRPAATSATARSMLPNCPVTARRYPLDINTRSTYFAITSTSRLTGVADRGPAERGAGQGGRDQRDRERVGRRLHHREADPVDRDRALLDQVSSQLSRDADADDGVLAAVEQGADAVHVALHEVAAEPGRRGRRALQVDRARPAAARCGRGSRRPRRR